MHAQTHHEHDNILCMSNLTSQSTLLNRPNQQPKPTTNDCLKLWKTCTRVTHAAVSQYNYITLHKYPPFAAGGGGWGIQGVVPMQGTLYTAVSVVVGEGGGGGGGGNLGGLERGGATGTSTASPWSAQGLCGRASVALQVLRTVSGLGGNDHSMLGR